MFTRLFFVFGLLLLCDANARQHEDGADVAEFPPDEKVQFAFAKRAPKKVDLNVPPVEKKRAQGIFSNLKKNHRDLPVIQGLRIPEGITSELYQTFSPTIHKRLGGDMQNANRLISDISNNLKAVDELLSKTPRTPAQNKEILERKLAIGKDVRALLAAYKALPLPPRK